MLSYRADLKQTARRLRRDMTDAEQKLWFRIRRKQLSGVQFYRQRPIGNYIVDFVAPSVRLVIELDGSQHTEESAQRYDHRRTHFLQDLKLFVMRFTNLQVLNETESVLDSIHSQINVQNSSVNVSRQ
jgi:very-short-patch-repair endonuclease